MANDKFKKGDDENDDLPDLDDFEEKDIADDDLVDDYGNYPDYNGPDELVAACLTVACELNKIRRKHHDDDKAFSEVQKTFEYIMQNFSSKQDLD